MFLGIAQRRWHQHWNLLKSTRAFWRWCWKKKKKKAACCWDPAVSLYPTFCFCELIHWLQQQGGNRAETMHSVVQGSRGLHMDLFASSREKQPSPPLSIQNIDITHRNVKYMYVPTEKLLVVYIQPVLTCVRVCYLKLFVSHLSLCCWPSFFLLM